MMFGDTFVQESNWKSLDQPWTTSRLSHKNHFNRMLKIDKVLKIKMGA